MEHGNDRADDGVALDLSFVPEWARQPPGANPYADARPDREPPPEKRAGRGRPGGRQGVGSRSSRPPRRGDRPAPRRGERPPAGRTRPDAPPRAVAPFPVTVAFLPARPALRAVVRRVQASSCAFPLLDLAVFFLSRDEFYEVKLEVRPDAASSGARLHRCELCGLVTTDGAAAIRHVVDDHATDLLDTEDVDQGPPSGAFVCVVRCRRGGHLVGPPNHHLYAERLADIRLRHFAGVPDDVFEGQLENVRDPETIEAWKKEVSIRKVFRRKDEPEAPPMDALAARTWLEDTAAARCRDTARAIVPGPVARKTRDEGLRRALGDAWGHEQRFPRSMLMALRPAFRHMGLHLFRAGDHAWFVTAVTPSAVAPDHAVEPVRRILEHVEAHPGVHMGPMLEALLPGIPADDPVRVEWLRQLRWLVAKGHVIEFHDGALSVPRSRGRPGSG